MYKMRSALLTAPAIASALILSGAAQARPMTPEDVAAITYTGNIAISADGSNIAYTSFSRPDVTQAEDNGRGGQRLLLADGPMEARAFLPDDVTISGIGFTPDNAMITYLWADEDDDRAVWGVPVNGGAPVKLASVADANVSAYGFAADGATIAMLVGPADDAQREEESAAGFDAVIYEEEQRFNRVFLAEIGDDLDQEPQQIDVPGHVDAIDLAPDGSFLVVTSAPTSLIDDSLVSRDPYIVDLITGDVTHIDTPGKIGDIEISPDGTQLSMVAATDSHDPAATTLHLVDVATGSYFALNEGAAEAIEETEWMADGRLAAIADIGAQTVLRFYSEIGGQLNEIDTGGLILSALQQGGNRLIAAAHSPQHPWEVFTYANGSFTRWTDHNPWLSEIDFGVQRTVTFAARDGQEVEGILIEPVGGIPFERAPTILDVHGGPEAHDSNGWVTGYSSPGQVAAGAGYAVFMPNYRGSTGYGVDFSKQHQGNYTDPEFTDLVDAKYALAEMGITDPDRVGVTGGSYGGYATAWSSTYHSAEFATGVMFVGISNQISKMGTGDIPHEMHLVHALQWPWDDWQYALEVSPIYYADRADTPLLILHGDSDTRVSPTQSTELYRHIRIRRPDTPLRLVFYPGEGHGNGMAAARYDYNLRMMEWFDTYLMTGDRDAPVPGPRPELIIADNEGEE